jgi:ABC-type Zn uptake system ZnuABC Zn-binding protein ZnuA
MPVVPNYKPPDKIEPNLEALAKIGIARVERERRLKQLKIDRMREEYKLNNPYYWLDNTNKGE